MTLHSILYNLTPLVTVIADLIIVSTVYPAFKRTKNKAFLFLTFACVLGIFDTICDHTIGLDAHRLGNQSYALYYFLRSVAYYAVVILDAVAVISLTKSFLSIHTSSTP